MSLSAGGGMQLSGEVWANSRYPPRNPKRKILRLLASIERRLGELVLFGDCPKENRKKRSGEGLNSFIESAAPLGFDSFFSFKKAY